MKNRDRILRIVVLALLLYALCSAAAAYRRLQRMEAMTQTLAAQNQLLRDERQELQRKLEQPPDEDEMRHLAWERLGMVMPGETVFFFTDEWQSTNREGSLWDWKLEALWKDG